MSDERNNEILSAEIIFTPGSALKVENYSSEETIQALAAIDQKMEKYLDKGDLMDYALASVSGFVCGLTDAIVVGSFDPKKDFLQVEKGKLFTSLLTILEQNGFSKKIIAEQLKKGKKVLADGIDEIAETVFEEIKKGVDKLSQKGDGTGLGLTILSNLISSGAMKNEKGEIVRLNEKEAYGPIILQALLSLVSWTLVQTEKNEEQLTEEKSAPGIKKIIGDLRQTPVAVFALKQFREVLTEATAKGSRELGSDGVKDESQKPSELLFGLFRKLLEKNGKEIPNLDKILASIDREAKSTELLDFSKVKFAGRQAFVVLLNEVIVRGFYFIRRLIQEAKTTATFEELDWNKILPFNNMAIARMMTASNVSLTGIDMLDAGVRAALESKMNAAVFFDKFASRVNFVGVGRLAVSVINVTGMAIKEAEYMRERRILIEQTCAETAEAILEYRRQMQALVEQYLAEDLQAFLLGFEDIDQGVLEMDSDRFLGGQVRIQRVLGRKVQFTDQASFDALMDSSDDFIL